MANSVLDELVDLSRRLGRPENDYVILGEGNTSAKIDADSFWVKASGFELASIGPGGFCRVQSAPLLGLLDEEALTDSEIKDRLSAATDHGSRLRPSVETVLHAQLLALPDVAFVAHTHPTEVLGLLCARGLEGAIAGRLFPDEIVCCGIAPVCVPYTDPGLPLAKAVRDAVLAFVEEYGERPRAVLMQSHGLIAIGDSPRQCEAVTAMWVKVARVLLRTAAFGGPGFLTPENVERIHTRPDEEYRRRIINGGA